jgi:hypothetical protein
MTDRPSVARTSVADRARRSVSGDPPRTPTPPDSSPVASWSARVAAIVAHVEAQAAPEQTS